MSVLVSLAAGWWCFPWGLIITPVQVVRIVSAMAGGSDDLRPSPMLEKTVRLMIASQLVGESRRRTPPPLENLMTPVDIGSYRLSSFRYLWNHSRFLCQDALSFPPAYNGSGTR